MTDEELRQAIEELNDAETEQDITILEKNIALMRDDMCRLKTAHAAYVAVADTTDTTDTVEFLKDGTIIDVYLAKKMRDDELRVCVKEFFDKYLNRREESSGGKMFNPIVVSCCRVMMTEPLNNLLARMAELSGAKPKESYD